MGNHSESAVESFKYYISSLNFFDFVEFETRAKSPSSSLNDDEEWPSGRDGSGVGPDLRRSYRHSKLAAKLNEFVLDGKVKYGLHRYANHSMLSVDNYCFVSNMNTSSVPSSFEEAVKDSSENKVCKLKKSLYRLEKAPREWNHKLSEALIYIDDIVITGTDENEIVKFKQFSSNEPMMIPLPQKIVFAHKDYEDDKYLEVALNFLRIKMVLMSQPFLILTGLNVQSLKDRSLDEAEYRSMVSATCEVMWILKVMKDLNVKILVPVDLYCDKKSAILFFMHEKSKHFDIDVHLGKSSSYARALIELQADVELKDTIMVFGHVLDECPKTIILEVVKNLKYPIQATRGVQADGKGSLDVVPGSFSTTSIVENIDKLEQKILDGKLMFVDDDGKPLYKVDYMGIADSKVEEVYNETAEL
ncbi:ribonuclease H-like domain-containing protein [Tanacetum coccineum]